VPATRKGLPSHVRRLSEFAARSFAMAFALLLHLVLLLMLLRPALPWPLRRHSSVAADRTLHVELLRRPKHIASAAPAITPPARRVPSAHPAPMRTAKAIPDAQATPPATQPELTQPLAPAAPYGNSRFSHALDEAGSNGMPPLPGASVVPAVPGIVVVTPPSLKSQIRDITRLHNCKNAIFKRNMTDEEMLKRGLTRMQMDKAFQDNCVH
jgi:hypothetical protein